MSFLLLLKLANQRVRNNNSVIVKKKNRVYENVPNKTTHNSRAL